MGAFIGRSLSGRQSASLVILNGQLAAHVRYEDGSTGHFRSNPDTGEFETFIEQPLDTRCEIDPAAAVATTVALDPVTADPWFDSSPATIEPDPEIAASSGENPANGNLQFIDRPIPYGRLYDQSLKDILVLVVLDKSATGSGSTNNLSSKTANYLSIMSNISAMYEHNLGLRIIVQEIILTPNTDDYDDVADGSGSLSDFRSWISSNRSRGTYDWTVAAKFGAVNGGGVLGVAYVGAAAGGSGVSINRTGNITVPAHEIGHNMGSGHSNGGVMNASANGSRNFFRNLESQERTSAWAIYNYMSNGGANNQGRAFPSNRKLRHAEQIPFTDDDTITTFPNQPVRFRPMDNDDTSVLNGADNTLTLVEVGAVFPPGAGEAWVYGDEIEFRPAPGFKNTAWLSYTIRGSVGNGGQGWLHKGDVAIRIDGSGANPPNIASTTTNPDFIHHSGSGVLTVNPLIDDHGPGHLNVSQVTPTLGTSGTFDPQDNGFLLANANLLDPDKGSISSARVDITLSGGSRVNLTRHLDFTPEPGATGPVRIEYTVADGNGNNTTQTATILLGVEEALLDSPSGASYLVPTDASDAATWMQEAFDDSSWERGDTGIGYETSTNGTLYTSLISTDTETAMSDAATSIYIRVPFNVPAPELLQTLRLQMQYDDGFVAYLNGTQIQSRNAPDPIAWDGVATDSHEAQIDSFSNYDISEHLDLLHEGTNILAIHGFNREPGSSDFIIRPRVVAGTKFTLGGVDTPRNLHLPAGVGLNLDGFLRGISEPPFANAATTRWSAVEAGVEFADPDSASTTATFSRPSNYTLRLRIEEAGYVEEHELQIAVGAATLATAPLVLAGPDLVVSETDAVRLIKIAESADTTTWQQIGGPTAFIAADGAVSFTTDGTHTFRLSGTNEFATTFDDVTVIRGTGSLDVGKLSRHLVPSSGDDLTDPADADWNTPAFDDADWILGPANYGFDRDSGYQDLFETDLQTAMHDNTASMLVRVPFFTPIPGNLQMSLRYEDGFAAFLNGVAVQRENSANGSLAWDATATGSRPDGEAIVPQEFDLGSVPSGRNTLAIQGLNSSTTSSDFLLIPELSVEITAGTTFQTQLVSGHSAAKFLTPSDAINSWESETFDDSGWLDSAAGVGYERSGSGNFDHHFHTDIESFVHDVNQTTYIRIPFIIPENFTVNSLTLNAKYDDAFTAHINGAEVTRKNFTGVASWNSAADSSRPEALTTTFEAIDLTSAISNLNPGRNILAIQLMNSGLTSSDLLFLPELVAEIETVSGTPYQRWFASIEGTDGMDGAPAIDLDADGLTNLLEFAFGGNPIITETVPIGPTIETGVFSYRRRADFEATGLTYTVESSPSLKVGSWTEATIIRENSSASADPEILNVSVRIPSSERLFYRLRVTLAQ